VKNKDLQKNHMQFHTSKCQKPHLSTIRARAVHYVGMAVLRKFHFLHHKDILSSCVGSTLLGCIVCTRHHLLWTI